MLKLDIVTIFPEMCAGPLGASMMKRAAEKGLASFQIHDLRDYTTDRHRTVDDDPYGGGQGMVMKPEPFFAIVDHLKEADTQVVLMTPQGPTFTQKHASDFSRETHLIVLCGHYEGIDHRVVEGLVDHEISIGDYVLTNGAIAANVFVDAIVRLIPGTLGDERSAVEESFSTETGQLEAPCYTRPVEFRDRRVPDVLLSGNHAHIVAWKAEQSRLRTAANRPDLLDEAR